MRKAMTTLAAALFTFIASNTVQGHHSGAMYDTSTSATVTGEVKEWRWNNPHASLQIVVTNDAGAKVVWSFVANSPNQLQQQGYRRSSMASGDKVAVTFAPLRDGGPGGFLLKVELADGRILGPQS